MTDQAGVNSGRDDRFQLICRDVAREMARLPIPGAVVGIAHGPTKARAASSCAAPITGWPGFASVAECNGG